MSSQGRTENFMALMDANRAMLDCYSQVNPREFKQMDRMTQRDFCYGQRVRVEELVRERRVKPADFFAAAQQAQQM